VLVRKTVTALFCDIDESVGLGERLDPETLRVLLARYFTEMSAVLERHGGTVEKYIGDAIVAIFGVPAVHEDDALRAVRAAAEMRGRLEELNVELERDYGTRIDLQIGIDTGEVVVGGDQEGTLATGDAMNVAARLQQAAGPGEILIGKSTYALVRDAVKAGPLETFPVKGKRKEVGRRRLDEVAPDAPAIARRLDAPLVGRREELRRLVAAFDRVVADRAPQLATVLGPAGIGKSRLATELVAALADRAQSATGRCLPYGEGITFWPLAEIVRRLGGDSAVLDALEGVEDGPGIGERVVAAVSAGEPGASEETFWAIRRFVEAAARRQPLLLVFEDIHWAEAMLLDLLEYLAGWLRDAPVLLLCLARPDLLERRPGWAQPRPGAELVTLEPLSPDDATALLEGLPLGAELSPDVRARIAAAAEGNPLFVEQLAAMAAEDGQTGELAVPPSIQALLAERLDRLPPEERAVMERASVMGREFWRRAVVDLSPMEEREGVGRNLLALVRKELLRPAVSTLVTEDAFGFRHALIRDAAYEGMPKELRADLHERFAGWLDENLRERAHELEEIVGYHLEQAVRHREQLGPPDERTRGLAARGGALLYAAGTRAFQRDDVPAARSLLERAASLLEPGAADRPQLLLQLGSVLLEAGELQQAEAYFRDAIEAAAQEGEVHVAAQGKIEREYLRLNLDPDADVGGVLAAIDEALPIFEARDDHRGRAKALIHRAEVHWHLCEAAPMEDALERALVHAQVVGDQRDISWILAGLARAALYGPRPVPDAIRRCTELSGLAGGRLVRAAIEGIIGVLEAMRGSPAEARLAHARSEQLFDELGLTTSQASMGMYAGISELITGDFERAERIFRRGYELLERLGEHSWLSTTAALLARAVYAQGRLDEAYDLTVASEQSTAQDDVGTHVIWRGTRAKVLAARGDTEAAEACAREAVRWARRTDFPTFQAEALADLGETLRLTGRDGEAMPFFEEARRLYDEKGDVVSATAIRRLLGVAGAAPPG
jgi:class 3 adenylate cyclase/tetratricopeptide (TPR) repeat protein